MNIYSLTKLMMEKKSYTPKEFLKIADHYIDSTIENIKHSLAQYEKHGSGLSWCVSFSVVHLVWYLSFAP